MGLYMENNFEVVATVDGLIDQLKGVGPDE